MKQFVACLLLVFISIHAYAIDDKVIKSSLEEKKVEDVKIEVLRIKGRKIDSPAKDAIKTVQDLLDDCYKPIKKGKDILPKLIEIEEAIGKIRTADAAFPLNYYLTEYEFLHQLNNHLLEAAQNRQDDEINIVKDNESEPIPTQAAEAASNARVENSQSHANQTAEQFTQPQISEQNSISKNGNEELATNVPSNVTDSSSNFTGTESTLMEKVGWFFFSLFILFLLIVIYRFRRKCPSCGKWNAMKTYHREFDHSETKSSGSSSKEVTYYRHIRKCKYCGDTDSVIRSSNSIL